jgi:hypothetical protein
VNIKIHLDGIYTLLKAYFCLVRWLACISELESYASSSLAAGRTTHAGQVSNDLSEKYRFPGPPGWKLRHEAENPIPVIYIYIYIYI